MTSNVIRRSRGIRIEVCPTISVWIGVANNKSPEIAVRTAGTISHIIPGLKSLKACKKWIKATGAAYTDLLPAEQVVFEQYFARKCKKLSA